jgi:hypothetical protein
LKACLALAAFALTLLAVIAGCGGSDDSADGDNVLVTLGLTEPDAQQYTTDKLLFDSFAYYAVAKSFKALEDDARADVIRDVASWGRTYLESDAFAERYAQQRKDAEPIRPEYTESVDDELERTLEKQATDFEETRKAFANLDEATREGLEESLETSIRMMNDPQMIEMQKQGIEQQRAAAQAEYVDSHARWEQEYPEDVSALIEHRLRDFLETTEDMDFDADLEERNGKQVFEDPELEANPADWKVYFRAGEEAVTAAREVAAEWLDDID